MLRPIPLRRYLRAMQAAGFTPEQVLQGTDVRAEALDDANHLIEMADYLRVVENIVRLSANPAIGLDMGLSRDIGDFRILGHAAMACNTPRQSMEAYWGRYGGVLGMLTRIVFKGRGVDNLVGDIEAVDTSPEVYRFLVEEALCLTLKISLQVIGTRPGFEKILLRYPRPGHARRYEELFECPVVFGAERTQVVFQRAWLDAPQPTTDAEMLSIFQHKLEHLKNEIERSEAVSARVRQVFLRSGHRIPLLEETADLLDLSTRTLRRRLMEEGTSYRRLIEAHRVALAQDAIRSGLVTAKQLSDHVGFDDVNAFRRAFKKWTGQTVGSYRR